MPRLFDYLEGALALALGVLAAYELALCLALVLDGALVGLPAAGFPLCVLWLAHRWMRNLLGLGSAQRER